MELVDLEAVRAAAKHLTGVAVRTPLLAVPAFGEELLLKPESLQPVGAFKLRGAYHTIRRIPADRRAAGVVAHSSGNHGQAVAYAARLLGVPAVVVMPDAAEPVKVAATRRLGAEVIMVPRADRDATMKRVAAERGMTPVPPFDHPDVIAGQGTVGLEIVEDDPDVEVVLVPVGGGGLASGVATAVKALRPATRVIAVEPALAADAYESFTTGELVTWPVERTYRTVADGLRTGLSPLTFAHIQARVDAVVTVTEDEIMSTVGTLAREARLVVEPSGAVSVAAALHHPEALPRGRTVAVLSGGNLAPAVLAAAVNSAG